MSPFKGKGLKKRSFNFETNYILDKFLVERAITLIYAQPKTGKSRFANGLSKYLATSTNFHVQYFDFDNSLSALKDRGIDDLVEELEGRFDYIHPEEVAVTSKEALDRLTDNAHNNVYAGYVLVFDSATDFCDEGNDNSVKIFMNKLKTLRNAGATIIILHHTNKKDPNYKGSTVFRSASDNVYSLVNEHEDVTGVTYLLEVDAGRFKVEDVAFHLTSEHYNLTQRDYADVRIPESERIFIREVTQALSKEENGLNQSKLLEKLGKGKADKTSLTLLERYTDKHWKFTEKGKSKIYTSM